MFDFLLPMIVSFSPIIIIVLIIIGVVSSINNRNKIKNMDPNQQVKPKETTGDILLNLGAIIALYVLVSNLLSLIFTVVNVAYPQITNGYNYSGSQSISWPVSILIVLFPIFVLIMWFLEKNYVSNPEKRNIGFHKGLTYTTLFIGGIILIGDLITVIYYFIDGQELTTGFLLKVFSLLIITLVVFLYYIDDVRNTLTPVKRKMWFYISLAIVVFSIIWGFAVLGSPRTQQLIKYDQQKVTDLQNLNNQVRNYYNMKNVLPNLIADLFSNNYGNPPTDPQTKIPYEYIKMNDTSFELCASFNKDSNDEKNLRAQTYPYMNGQNDWSHSEGRYCFIQTVTPNPSYLK